MAQLNHLKKRSEFLWVARRGRKVVTAGFVAQILPLGEGRAPLSSRVSARASGLRVGFTVTKKVGNSVVRNRTRRRLREAVRLAVVEYDTAAGGKLLGDVVLIGRNTTRDCSFQTLKADVRRVLEAIGGASPLRVKLIAEH